MAEHVTIEPQLATRLAEIRQRWHAEDLDHLLADADHELDAVCLQAMMLDDHKESVGKTAAEAFRIIDRGAWAAVASFAALRDALKYGAGKRDPQSEIRHAIGEILCDMETIESLAGCLQDDDDVHLGEEALQVVEAIEEAAGTAKDAVAGLEEMLA